MARSMRKTTTKGETRSMRVLAPFWALAAAATLAGCMAEGVLPKDYGYLPEGSGVDTAPWPRLVDGPVSLDQAEAGRRISRGGQVNRDLDARIQSLSAKPKS